MHLTVAKTLAAILMVALGGCATPTSPEEVIERYSQRAGVLDVRKDMFASTPIWEAPAFSLTGTRIEAAKSGPAALDVELLGAEMPGLAILWNQVFPSSKQLVVSLEGTRIAPEDAQGPLPGAIASTKVAQVITKALVASVSGTKSAQLGMMASPQTRALLDDKLTLKDFWEFGQALSASNAELLRGEDGKGKGCPADGQLRFKCIYLSYFTDYYKGEFTDRNGSVLAKPKLGLTISNETITGVVSVFLEATFDWTIIASKLEVPVVFEGDPADNSKWKWLTPKEVQPSLARFVLASDENYLPVLGRFDLIEPVSDAPGISKLKMCGIRLAGGLAADSAQPVSGAIMRLFGGANIGFVVLGKFSFGDNETLTKLVDTFVEVVVRRLTEGAITQLVYPAKDNELPPPLSGALFSFLPACK